MSDLEWYRSNTATRQQGEEDSNKTTMGTETRGSMSNNDNNNARGCQREVERISGMVATRLTQERDSEEKEMQNDVFKGGE